MTTNQARATQIINAKLIESCYPEDIAQALADAGLLTPAPKPRTLADLLAAGHAPEEYQWMQATYLDSHYDQPGDHVISNTAGNYVRLLRRSDGMSFEVRDRSRVIPSQELPRMVWPEEQATEEDVSIIPPEIDTFTGHDDDVDMAPEDAPEVEEGTYGQAFWEMVTKAIRSEKEHFIDVQDYDGVKRWRDAERALGAAMGTNPPKESSRLPLPEDAPDGYYLVRWWGEEHPVPAGKVQGQWRATGWRAGILPAKEITIVSRLVPEVEA